MLDCDIVVSEFELQLSYYVSLSDKYYRERCELPFPVSYELNNIFFKDSFGIKYPTKLDIPLNKKVKETIITSGCGSEVKKSWFYNQLFTSGFTSYHVPDRDPKVVDRYGKSQFYI